MPGLLHVSVARVALRGYDDICSCFHGADFEVVPLSTHAVRGAFEVFSIGDLTLSAGAFEASHRTRGVINHAAYTFGVPLEFGQPSAVTQWGVRATPGDVYFMPPATDQDGWVLAGTRYVTLNVDQPGFERLRLAELELGDDTWSRRRHVQSSRDAARQLTGAVVRVVKTLGALREGVSPAQASHLQDRMLSPMLAALDQGSRQRTPASSPLPRRTIRALEDWVDGHPSSSLTARELALALRMPLRTLQRACSTSLGLGPHRYLTLRRLARVRSTLLEAEPGETTVSAVAAEHGFLEFGRFAGLYRRWYGELPSTTLAYHRVVHGHRRVHSAG